MLKTLRNAWKIKEIRTKLIFTFLMLVVIRFGSELPIPGVKTDFFANFFANQSTDAFGFFNAMTGGSFSSMSIFALSITPYITSSIIMQLLTIAIPKLEEMQRDGEDGRKKIAEYTRYLTVALALIESIGMAVGFGGQGLLINYNVWSVVIAVATMTAGSAFLMWIGERITEKGVGNFHRPAVQYRILSPAGCEHPVHQILKQQQEHRIYCIDRTDYDCDPCSYGCVRYHPSGWRAQNPGPVF